MAYTHHLTDGILYIVFTRKLLQTMYRYCCPNCTHSGSASQLYLLFTHLKSAITRFVSFSAPQRVGSLKENQRKGSYSAEDLKTFHFRATQDSTLSSRALFEGTHFYCVVKADEEQTADHERHCYQV